MSGASTERGGGEAMSHQLAGMLGLTSGCRAHANGAPHLSVGDIVILSGSRVDLGSD